MRTLGRRGSAAAALAGALLGAGYALQTAGLERTSVSSTGFITGMYVVLTPLLALVCFRDADRRDRLVRRRCSRRSGSRCSPASTAARRSGDLLVLAGAAVYSLQIVLMERYAPRYDALAFTLVEMLAAFAGLLVVAVLAGQLAVPHGWTVWGALLVTGVFASALAFLAQTWAQRRASATQTALAFSLEPVWAAFFGFTLAGDRLGVTGWLGCARDHGRHRPRRARDGRPAPPAGRPAGARMTAVLLALASAALFGGMTVALRLGLRGLGDSERRRARDGDRRARRRDSSRRRSTSTCTARGRSCSPGCSPRAASQILFTLAVGEVGASRTSVMVGGAPLVAVAIAVVFLGRAAAARRSCSARSRSSPAARCSPPSGTGPGTCAGSGSSTPPARRCCSRRATTSPARCTPTRARAPRPRRR